MSFNDRSAFAQATVHDLWLREPGALAASSSHYTYFKIR